MSMDFVYDLTDKLKEQKIDYLLVTVRTGEKSDNADVFYHFKDQDSVDSLVKVLNTFEDIVIPEQPKKQPKKNDAKTKNTSKKTPRKNRRKKDKDEE